MLFFRCLLHGQARLIDMAYILYPIRIDPIQARGQSYPIKDSGMFSLISLLHFSIDFAEREQQPSSKMAWPISLNQIAPKP